MPRNVEGQIRFEWDEAKNRSNIKKHGFDFADAAELFGSPLLTQPDAREDYGEERWVGLGTVHGRVAVIVFSPRGPNVVRVISIRKASREERKEYEQAIQNRLGTH
jgi:uncharacterized protein